MKLGAGISITHRVRQAPPATVKRNAFTFTGANSVSLPTVINLTTFTFMFYVKSNYSTGTTLLFDCRDSSTDGFRIQQTVSTSLNSLFNATSAPTTIAGGSWKHFAVTCDGANMKTYVDGALSVTQAVTGTISVTTAPRIGARNFSSPTGFWSGQLAQFSVWNVALSQAEISAKIDQFYADVADKTGLLHWWALTNITTSTVTDLHGSNHGTIQ